MKVIYKGIINKKNKWVLHPEIKQEVDFIEQLCFALHRNYTGSITLGSENPIDDKLEVFTKLEEK